MPHITIDGTRIETEPGKTIIEAAYANGMEIPHFCWHPELSVAGNCRMCLVEVGMPKRLPDGSFEKDAEGNTVISYMPKLQIACATPVTEGMSVRTKSKAAVRAQEAVMEFLLINHPLDCPICDEAGQCKLQEYEFRHSNGVSRFDEHKNIKRKRIKWSDHIVFDAERCILCSRCIRFSEEIGKQKVLTFVQRNDHVTIELAEGQQLDNPYSMNVIDICPVGALTSNDFRFKARVWEMAFSETICPGCARGCNIKGGTRNNQILQLGPRANPYVNHFWSCDYGRLSQIDFVNSNRIAEPMIKSVSEFVKVDWQEAYTKAAAALSKFKPDQIMVIGCAKSTNEDNYVLARFAREVLKTNNIDFIRHIDESFGDDFLRVSDMTPNTNGAVETGVVPGKNAVTIENLADNIRSGKIKALYIMEDDFYGLPEIESQLDKLELIIVHSYNHKSLTEKAHFVLPASTYAEVEGTFTNVDKRVQHIKPFLVTRENLRFMGMTMSRLDRFGAHNDRWTQHEERNCRQSWRILQAIANKLGAGWSYKSSLDVFNDIADTIPSFKGMSYELLDEYQGLVLWKADKPDPKVHNYVSNYMRPD
jgi:NADH-quinone oxidoreductase subunit G